MDTVTWELGDCHPSSGTATITPVGDLMMTATFLATTPSTGNVRLEIPPLPPVQTMLLEPCP